MRLPRRHRANEEIRGVASWLHDTTVQRPRPVHPGPALATTEPAEGIAYLIYTSGSTGRLKSVVIERPALRNYLRWCDDALPFSGGTRRRSLAPPSTMS
jgi:non-ribosomal peptide synthetase component F